LLYLTKCAIFFFINNIARKRVERIFAITGSYPVFLHRLRTEKGSGGSVLLALGSTAGISKGSFAVRVHVVHRKFSGKEEAEFSSTFTGESSLRNAQSNFYIRVEKIIHLSTLLCFQNYLKRRK
jgi:hypothetical protein